MYRVRCHLNRTQIRSVLGIAACVVVYTTLTDAGKHIVSGPDDMRHELCVIPGLNVNPTMTRGLPRDTGEAYFTAGVGNREFVVAVERPDQTHLRLRSWVFLASRPKVPARTIGQSWFSDQYAAR